MSFRITTDFYFLCKGVFQCGFLATSYCFLTKLYYLQKAGIFTCGSKHVKNPRRKLPALQSSRRTHKTARSKARRLRVYSPAGSSLTYLQFAGGFTLGVTTVLPEHVGTPACDCRCLGWQIACISAYKSWQFCVLVAVNFAWAPHVELPVK